MKYTKYEFDEFQEEVLGGAVAQRIIQVQNILKDTDLDDTTAGIITLNKELKELKNLEIILEK